MAQAEHGDTVKVHYTGTLEDGTVFDSSMNHEPLEFTIGEGKLIPGFEQVVLGMSPGESNTETVLASQAYGPRREEMVLEVDREQMPLDLNPEAGQQLQVRRENGQTIQAVVTDVSELKMTLDANHPLAGKDLIFQIQLLEIS